jgi:hypothetical protein
MSYSFNFYQIGFTYNNNNNNNPEHLIARFMQHDRRTAAPHDSTCLDSLSLSLKNLER